MFPLRTYFGACSLIKYTHNKTFSSQTIRKKPKGLGLFFIFLIGIKICNVKKSIWILWVESEVETLSEQSVCTGGQELVMGEQNF